MLGLKFVVCFSKFVVWDLKSGIFQFIALGLQFVVCNFEVWCSRFIVYGLRFPSLLFLVCSLWFASFQFIV